MALDSSMSKLIDFANFGDNYQTMDEGMMMGDISQAKTHALGKKERELHRLVQLDDINLVMEHIQANPDVDVNTRDMFGRTALTFAVRNQNEELVEYFLSIQETQPGDILLVAVREENIEIVVMILKWLEIRDKEGIKDEAFESAEFPSHMTALMLACHQDSFAIVQLLIERGHELHVPDPDATDNKDAVLAEFGETLEAGTQRIDSYKALSSPSYISLTSKDPILTAFNLSNKARKLAFKDPIFREDYNGIAEIAEKFAVGLLEQCRTSEEVWLLLKQDHDEREAGTVAGGEYPRLSLALDFHQKDFVVHKNCQQVLQNLWTQHHPDVMWMNMPQRIIYFFPRILLLPIIYLIFIFAPCAPFLNYWQAPMNRFMGDMVSYFLFLGLLLYSVIQGESETWKRFPDMTWVDVIVILYILSFVWDHVKYSWYGGISAYMTYWWLSYELIMVLCFVTSFAARLASAILVFEKGSKYEHEERRFWPGTDPALVSEAFYCIGSVFATGKLLYVFQMSQILGPLQLSLSRMIYDVIQMFCIIFLALFAFSSGLYRLNGYYKGAVRIDPDGKTKEQSDSFDSWGMSFRTLFWNIFGYGDFLNAQIVVPNTCPSPNNTMPCFPPVDHTITEGLGYVMYGLYHLVMITTLLNMMIALMSNSLNAVQENADKEWKFGRSMLWMNYLDQAPFLPNPLNILPTPLSIWHVTKWCHNKCCGGKDRAKWSRDECCYIVTDEMITEKKADVKLYRELVGKLVRRHLNQLEHETQAETVTPEHLEQMKLDIVKDIEDMLKPSGKSRRNTMLDT